MQRPVDVIAEPIKRDIGQECIESKRMLDVPHCSHSRVAELLNDPGCEPNGRIGSAHRTASVVECHADGRRRLLRLSKRQLCPDTPVPRVRQVEDRFELAPLAAGNGVFIEAKSELGAK